MLSFHKSEFIIGVPGSAIAIRAQQTAYKHFVDCVD